MGLLLLCWLVFHPSVLFCQVCGRDLFPHPVGRAGGSFENRVLGGFMRIRLNRKAPAHLARLGNLETLQSRSRVWKRLRVFLELVGVQFVVLMLCMSVVIVLMGHLWMTRLGLDNLRLHWPTSPGFA